MTRLQAQVYDILPPRRKEPESDARSVRTYLWSGPGIGSAIRMWTTTEQVKRYISFGPGMFGATALEHFLHVKCMYRQGNSLHVAMCMHTGREPQFTYGHVHVHRQEATVYIWSCACTQAGSHSLHMAMCMHKGKEELEFTCGHVYVKAACTSRQPTEGQRSLQGK